MLSKYLYRHTDSQANYDAIRYSGITAAIAGIHLLFLILFFIMGVYPMVAYNSSVFVMYIIISKNLSNLKKYNRIYFIFLFEVVIHAFIATIFVGWDFGFMFYIIAFIPCCFFLTFSIAAFKRQMMYPFITTAFVFGFFVIAKCISYFIDPIYTDYPNGIKILFYFINIFIGFFTTLFFSALFSIEVNSMQMKMENDQQNLEDQASYDPLTHFLNRRSMNERLNHAQRNAIINEVPYSLIMSDIDNFKKFNDTYGHDCGDYVLQTISKIMGQQIRTRDSACRWGGEEFLLLVAEGMDAAIDVAERIRSNVENYDFTYEGQALHVTITLGVSTYYANSKVKTLIEIADKRLYKGKENGKNQVVSS